MNRKNTVVDACWFFCTSHRSLVIGLTVYLVSGLVAFVTCLAVIRVRNDLIQDGIDFGRFDTVHYCAIATRGYEYSPGARSDVAFFPLFPLTARATHDVSGLTMRASTIVVSQLAFVLGLIAFHFYLRTRQTTTYKSRCAVQRCGRVRIPIELIALFSCAFWPTTFFFRLAYSESLFLLVVLALFVGIERRWNVFTVVWLAGLATLARPVGVATVLPVCLYVYETYGRSIRAMLLVVMFLPIATWGLLCYMLFQYVEFNEPFAFAKTQTFCALAP